MRSSMQTMAEAVKGRAEGRLAHDEWDMYEVQCLYGLARERQCPVLSA
jgi:hypothetical protein